jgi:hypothetical protein
MATPIRVPVVQGYNLTDYPDFSNLASREKLSGAALRGFFAIAKAWGLTPEQESALLGGIPRSTLFKLRSTPNTLSQDALTRISYIGGIYKALEILLPEKHADRWMTSLNDNLLFRGAAPISYAMTFGLPGLHDIRKLLDGVIAGH